MKILMVNKFLYARGGAETYFLKIGSYLERLGHQVEYFGMYDEKNMVSNSANEYTSHLDFHRAGIKRILYPIRIIYSFQARKRVRKVIRKFEPDIVHLNNINFQLTPSVIEEIHWHNIPMIQTVHDSQMICPNHIMFNLFTKKPCDRCLKGSKWNCARYHCIHASRVKSVIGSIEALLYVKRKTYGLVDLFICPSYFMEEKLRQAKHFSGKTAVLHNFIELGNREGTDKKEDYILYFGRLSEEKGVGMFLNCCRKLPHIKVKIAGTGPLEHMCTGIPNVEFVGFKTGNELDTLIKKAKFSVYPSICYENCPLSVLESESLGTPVIASKLGGIPELIEDNETGILIEDINEDNFTKEIDALYKDDRKIQMMSEKCIAKRTHMVSIEDYGNKMIEIYSQYINRRKDETGIHSTPIEWAVDKRI
ncbi:MAG TPA: glycosyltransferase family 4 protein [Clostridiales bacterium]|nr:glycosyltransferase family 4 protein [Clostridiales bacterium]